MKRIVIRNKETGIVIFEYSCLDNTIRKTVEAAVRKRVSLKGADLEGADLKFADLIGADFRWAYLVDADLRHADAKRAVFDNANLTRARLNEAILIKCFIRSAVLDEALLRGACLRCAVLDFSYCRDTLFEFANLRYSSLKETHLYGAVLEGADLYKANLRMTMLDRTVFSTKFGCVRGLETVRGVFVKCPSEGSFIGWKVVLNTLEYSLSESFLVKLLIPEDARRISGKSSKCRCDKAKVLSITHISSGEEVSVITNMAYEKCRYEVGSFVYPDSFDSDRWNDCTHGIHFFIDKQEAIFYGE